MLERLKEKMHIIFIVVMIIYLSALAIKTGQTYLKERPYWEEQEKQQMSSQTTQRQVGK
jgi:uncharacterized protein YxeA